MAAEGDAMKRTEVLFDRIPVVGQVVLLGLIILFSPILLLIFMVGSFLGADWSEPKKETRK